MEGALGGDFVVDKDGHELRKGKRPAAAMVGWGRYTFYGQLDEV
jgi:hypothetical protein